MDCSLPGSSVHGDSPCKDTGVDCHDLFQGIFPSKVLNPGLPHCRQVLYHLSHQGRSTKHAYILLRQTQCSLYETVRVARVLQELSSFVPWTLHAGSSGKSQLRACFLLHHSLSAPAPDHTGKITRIVIL